MPRSGLLASVMVFAATPQGLLAQDGVDDWVNDTPGNLSFSLAIAATNSEIVLTESELSLPDDLALGDFEVTLADEVKVSNTFVGANVGYRLLPFLQLGAQAGFISTTSDLGLTINGTPADTFPINFGGPITLQQEVSTSADGYSFGLSATGLAPLATIGEGMLVGYATYSHAWNEFSDDGISVDIGRITTGVIFPVEPQREDKVAFRLAVSYLDTRRTLERGVEFSGEEIMVRAVQETEDPWFGEFGITIPASRHILLNLGTSVQTTGDISVLGSITFRP